jgi:hypothetical protein
MMMMMMMMTTTTTTTTFHVSFLFPVVVVVLYHYKGEVVPMEVKLHAFLILSLDCREWSASRSGHFNHGVRSPVLYYHHHHHHHCNH